MARMTQMQINRLRERLGGIRATILDKLSEEHAAGRKQVKDVNFKTRDEFVEAIRTGKIVMNSSMDRTCGTLYTCHFSYVKDAAKIKALDVKYAALNNFRKETADEIENIIDKMIFSGVDNMDTLVADFNKFVTKLAK